MRTKKKLEGKEQVTNVLNNACSIDTIAVENLLLFFVHPLKLYQFNWYLVDFWFSDLVVVAVSVSVVFIFLAMHIFRWLSVDLCRLLFSYIHWIFDRWWRWCWNEWYIIDWNQITFTKAKKIKTTHLCEYDDRNDF